MVPVGVPAVFSGVTVSRKMGKGEELAHPNQGKTLAKDPAKGVTPSTCDYSVPSWQNKQTNSLASVAATYTLGGPVCQECFLGQLNGQGGQNIVFPQKPNSSCRQQVTEPFSVVEESRRFVSKDMGLRPLISPFPS